MRGQNPQKKLEIEYWLRLAISDCEAAKILYIAHLNVQALYFVQQALEKVNKAVNLRLKDIKDGKEISHALHLSLTKRLEGIAKREIDDIFTRLGDAEKTEIRKDPKKFMNYVNKRELNELKEILIATHISKSKAFVEFRKRLDLEKYLNECFKIFEKGLVKYKKLEKTFRKSIANGENNEEIAKKFIEYRVWKTDYAYNVALRLAVIFPNPQTFRYPEHKPFEVYNEKNVLVKRMDEIIRHVYNSCKIYSEVYGSF
jgi:HEPN domain-containing protein